MAIVEDLKVFPLHCLVGETVLGTQGDDIDQDQAGRTMECDLGGRSSGHGCLGDTRWHRQGAQHKCQNCDYFHVLQQERLILSTVKT